MKYILLFLFILSFRQTYAQRAGDLDSTFGINGSVIFTSKEGIAQSVYVLPSGSFFACGYYSIDYALMKFNANGTLDNSFNNMGMDTFFSYYSAEAIAAQQDGKIITTGEDGDAITMRFNPNGGLDSQFNDSGIVITDVPYTTVYYNNQYYTIHYINAAHAVVVQPDGKIIAGGDANYYGFTLMRYNINGSLDSSFGGTGIVTDSLLDNCHGNTVALQPDGKIIIGGSSGYTATRMTLLRYNPTGTLDSTFGNNGVVITTISNYFDEFSAIALLPDGKILGGGISWQGSIGSDFALVRYMPDGTLDSSFGLNGIVVTDLGNGENDRAYAMAVQQDGKIVLAGRSYGATRRFALARYLPDGSLDTSFGNDGKVVTAISGSNNSEIYGMGLQPDGGIIVCGHTDNNGINHFVVSRYLGVGHVGIHELKYNQDFFILPNPNSGNFTLKGESNAKEEMLNIYNTIGQIIYSGRAIVQQHRFQKEINLVAPSGVYIIRLTDNQCNTTYHQFIIN